MTHLQSDRNACRLVVLTTTLNDWQSIHHLLPLIDANLAAIDARATVVVVDDGSQHFDGKSEIRATAFARIDEVVVLSLHRNLGNQRALAVGMGWVAGNLAADLLVVMDGDHEDDPAYIPALFAACRAHGDSRIVFAERTKRSEGHSFLLFYRAYQFFYRWLTGVPIAMGNYSVLPWSLATRLAHVSELWSHFPAAIMKARFPFATVPAERGRRLFGKSKMNIVSLVVHAINGFAVHADTVVVRLLLGVGGLAAAAVMLVAVLVALKLFSDLPIIGWTSQVLGLVLLFLVQLLAVVCVMVFLVITVKLQPAPMPAYEYPKHLWRVERLLAAIETAA